MEQEILKRLEKIEELVQEGNMLRKDVLTFNEAVTYLNISPSFLYKKTSQMLIPHYKPNGKLIYFNRAELDQWMLKNRVKTQSEIDTMREGGRRLAEIMDKLKAMIAPGITGIELNRAAEALILDYKATPSFKGYVDKKVGWPWGKCRPIS